MDKFIYLIGMTSIVLSLDTNPGYRKVRIDGHIQKMLRLLVFMLRIILYEILFDWKKHLAPSKRQ